MRQVSSWNSSSDINISRWHAARTTRAKRCISMFLVFILWMSRLLFVANSPLNVVFTFTLSCLSIVTRTCSNTISYFSLYYQSLLPRLDVIRIDYPLTGQNSRTRRRSLSRRKIFRCYSRVRHSRSHHQHARNVTSIVSLYLRFARSLPPWTVCVQWGADAWHDKVLRAVRCTRSHTLPE